MKQTSWEPVHKWYDESLGQSGDYMHTEIIIPKTLALLRLETHSSLLDLGCGQGILARFLPQTVGYSGVDISPSLIAKAKARDSHPGHRYSVGDITRPLGLPERSFTHAVSILTIDNIENPKCVFEHAAQILMPQGVFTIVINHPCFRIPRQSGWDVDQKSKLQFRRINRYLTPLKIPITMHPGYEHSEMTWTFHFPISYYTRVLADSGYVIETMEEWTSDKKSVGKAASMENRARTEFPLFLSIKAVLRG